MKRLLLTGAASGIGRACALEFARRGDHGLILVDRDGERLADTARAVRALGALASTVIADLADPAAIERIARDVGSVDILFSNAGVAVVKPLDATSTDDWHWIVDVNLWAPIRLVRAFVPAMPPGSRIALTASMAGLVGAPGMVAYSTTKSGLVGFADALRAELDDIAITVVCPGYVRTELHRATRYSDQHPIARLLDAPPAWYGLRPERAARRIVTAIERREPQVVMGIEKLGWYVKRFSPAASFAISRWTARRMGL
jgi:NAD(P)-dependent dehydrogenase (short-subunit alcohol dehydrogenase family)